MTEVCADNRFEIIADYKRRLVEGTNIETKPEEMAVLDSILYRFWQMGWLTDMDQGHRPNIEKVIRGLTVCTDDSTFEDCRKCPYQGEDYCTDNVMTDALALLDTMYRAWETVKFSVLDTAQNNAGENEDVYKILMFVARLMDNQEKGWNDV